MKTLYISDLDGTLLNPDAELSSYTIQTINDLIGKGMNFTVATARSAASAVHILKDLHLTLPIVLMNGVLIYDIPARQYIKIEYLSPETLAFIYKVLNDFELTGFLYEVKDNMLSTYYETLENQAQIEFLSERVNKYRKVFTKVESFTQVEQSHLIYLSLLNTKKRLEGAYQILKTRKDIGLAYYRDVYSKEEMWYLEIFSHKATKYNAVQYLRNTYHFDKIIGFGDNLNDLPLFQACDITCAVANAKEELKKYANYITESNINNGVAEWLRRNYSDVHLSL
ncbi:MAG: HAD family hydrolase [Lachnoclostridium sp.]|jgi:5-amino-6-(5-phospho-D-ribitylamino)uracil phosphatase